MQELELEFIKVVNGGTNCFCYNMGSIVATTESATDTLCWGFCCGSTGLHGKERGYEYAYQGPILRNGGPRRVSCASTESSDDSCCTIV
jgi:hypothetical protein